MINENFWRENQTTGAFGAIAVTSQVFFGLMATVFFPNAKVRIR